MLTQQLERLRERLLRAGVAPRHVRRYMHELRDHYEDAVRDELAKGSNRDTAEQSAWGRLGTEEHLAQSVLAQPELRSMAARYPRLVFGAAPVLMWIGSFVLTFFALALLFETFTSLTGREPRWMLAVEYVFCVFDVRILPVSLGIAMLIASARQRLTPRWPIVGATILVALSGTISVNLSLPASLADKGQLGMNSSLLPFIFPSAKVLGEMDMLALSEGLARALLMLAITLAPYLLWRRHQRMVQAKL